MILFQQNHNCSRDCRGIILQITYVGSAPKVEFRIGVCLTMKAHMAQRVKTDRPFGRT